MTQNGGTVRVSDLTKSQRRTMPDKLFCQIVRARMPDPRVGKEKSRPIRLN